jgi:hypothetical protein
MRQHKIPLANRTGRAAVKVCTTYRLHADKNRAGATCHGRASIRVEGGGGKLVKRHWKRGNGPDGKPQPNSLAAVSLG